MATNQRHRRSAYALLKADVRKAHWREKVRTQDWKYLVSAIGEEYYVYTCGVYGCASAHLFCARKAALLIRLLWAFI